MAVGWLGMPEESRRRETFNLMLSMPAGTDRGPSERRQGHSRARYSATDDRTCSHSMMTNRIRTYIGCVVLTAVSESAQADLRTWREVFARQLREHGSTPTQRRGWFAVRHNVFGRRPLCGCSLVELPHAFTDQCSMSGQQWCYGTHISKHWQSGAGSHKHWHIPVSRKTEPWQWLLWILCSTCRHGNWIPALPDSSRPPSAHIVTAPSRTGISPTSREDSAVSMTGQPNLIRHLTETDTTLSVHALDGSRVSCGGAAGDWHRVKRRRPSV